MKIEATNFFLKEESKALKTILKCWNKEFLGWLDLKVDEDVKYFNDMYVVVGNYGEDLVSEIVEKRNMITHNI